LFVMGEGRGGTEGGRVESRLAVSAVLANFRASAITEPRERLVDALTHAGEVLFARARSASAFHDTHAACVAVLVRRGRLYAARVGDLHLDLVQSGETRSLFGVNAEGRPQLGQAEEPFVEIIEHDINLQAGDRFLLGNAGLFQSVSAEEISRIVTTLVPPVAARRLVEAADRGAVPQAVSVQVVQVGDATLIDEVTRQNTVAGRRDSATSVPVAPVRLGPSPTAAPPPMRHAIDIPIPAPSSSTGGSSWKWVVAIVVALAASAWFVQSVMKSDDQSDFAARAASSGDRADTTAVETSDVVFWDRVDNMLQESGETLKRAQVERWLRNPDEAARVLRNARAVVAALAPTEADVLAVEEAGTLKLEPAPNPEDMAVDSESEPSEEPVAARQAPPTPPTAAKEEPLQFAEVRIPKPADSAEAGAPRTESTPWNPTKLSAGLRGFERIFKQDDKLRAARQLRGYIHRRHKSASSVFKQLDMYLEVAPKERSLSVLSKMSEVRPGPKTARWVRRHVRVLRRDLGIAP